MLLFLVVEMAKFSKSWILLYSIKMQKISSSHNFLLECSICEFMGKKLMRAPPFGDVEKGHPSQLLLHIGCNIHKLFSQNNSLKVLLETL